MFGKLFDIERIIHSIKTVIACIIAFLLTRFIGFPADQWIVISVIVVMCAQLYVGSVIGKAYLRFLGTLIGCLFAAMALMVAGNSYLAIIGAISLSSFIFSYIATSQENFSYMGTLGAVTTAIIMLGINPTLTFAAERFLEISVGIFIATLVSQFILPIHARNHLRRFQAATLLQLRDYYVTTMVDLKHAKDIDVQELNETIVKVLTTQRQLAKESVREPFGVTFDPSLFMQSLHAEREILRAISFMHNAFILIKRSDSIFHSSPAFAAFNETVLESLDILAKALKSKEPIASEFHIPPLTPLKNELEKEAAISSRDEVIYIDGFLFCAEMLVVHLTRLAQLYKLTIVPAV